MKNHYASALHYLTLLFTLFLVACSGGGGGGGTNGYTIGGSVTGLTGTLVLQNNAGDNLSVTGSSFTFATAVASGGAYNVSILTQPDKQRCFVSAGAGTASGNISNITIACASQKGGAMQGVPLNLTPTVSTLAGAAIGADGTGVAARFNFPRSVVSVGGNLFVADTYNHKIRKIVTSTGSVTTLAGSGTYGAADGVGAAATFNSPGGIATDGTNLYVADSNNNKIRKIVISTGEVSSLTGTANTASVGSATDGAGTGATFFYPDGITTDGLNLYVADSYNYKIRKIVIASGVVSSLTGVTNVASTAGAVDGYSSGATFRYPAGITTDGTNLYVADRTNYKVRVVAISSGNVSTLAGSGVSGYADGIGTAAILNQPLGIATDGTNLYVSTDPNNGYETLGSIRKIALATASVTTLAGNPLAGSDGTGSAASLNGLAVTSDGSNLYMADSTNHKILKIGIASGVVSTLAGSGSPGAADGAGSTASFSSPNGITTDGTNLYVSDLYNNKIRKVVIATGMVSSMTGAANTPSAGGAADGVASLATFINPYGITTDGTNLYVADSGNHKIRQIAIATGMVSSITGVANLAGSSGAKDGAGAAATLNSPYGITTDGTNLYVADTINHKIRKIVIATGVVSSITGIADTTSSNGAADGPGTTAKFFNPYNITTDGTNLYVADSYNRKIRKIVLSTSEVSSLTGTANTSGIPGATDGAGTAATFYITYGLTTDGAKLFVADYLTIRQIQ